MANYNVGNIEIGVITSSKNVVSNLDVIINKLKDFKKIDKGLQDTFLRVNQLANGISKMSKVDLSPLTNNLKNVSTLLNNLNTRMNNGVMPNETYEQTAVSLNKLANAFRKFDNIKNFDFRAMYSSFSTMGRILDPFLEKLKKSEETLKALASVLNSLKARTITKATNEVSRLNRETKKVKENTLGIKNNFNKLFDVGKIYFLFNYSKRIVSGIARMVSYASDYAEILNKFQVSFGSIYEDNLKSVNQLAEAFGFSTNTLMDYTATFNNMLQSLGNLSDKTNASISQSLTRMAIDYSSLFNVSIQRAMEAFQSAISGNIRTLRSISGFDVSEITIFSIYQELGGTKSMRQLNQLEKRLLRIIAIQRQMGETGAVGDYGRTINCGFDKKLSNDNRAKSVKILLKGKYRDNFIDSEKAIKYCRA